MRGAREHKFQFQVLRGLSLFLRPLTILFILGGLSSCSVGDLLPKPERSPQVYDLRGGDSPCSEGNKFAKLDGISQRIAIDPMQTSPWFESRHIVFRRSDREVGTYQFALLTEPPSQTFASMLRAELLCPVEQHSAIAVTESANYRLQWRLERFEHDAREDPGSAIIRLSVDLVDGRGELLDHLELHDAIPLQTYDAAGAVAGFAQGMSEGISRLGEWLRKALPPSISPDSPPAEGSSASAAAAAS